VACCRPARVAAGTSCQSRTTSGGADQLSRYLDEGAVIDGTHVRIAELCGQPGYVVLMNQRVLHVAARNVLTAPRLMLSDFVA
jgi:hypothetical protein